MTYSKRRALSRIRVALSLALLSSVLYAVITWFVGTTFSAIKKSESNQLLDDLLRLDANTAIALLRVFQGVLTLASSSAIASSLELVQRSLCAREDGLSYAVFLILSSATGLMATCRIFLSPIVKRSHRLWACIKLTLSILIWLAALLLFVRTSIVTVYDTALTYNVTAGIGPFNASYINPFFDNLKELSPGYPYQVLPYTSYAMVFNLVVNPTQASACPPIQCPTNSTCDSYFLSGGMAMTTPWIPDVSAPSPMAMLPDVQGIQLDFQAGSGTDDLFSKSDCETYGADGVLIGIKMCVKPHESDPNLIVTGIFICQNGTPNGTCLPSPPPGITSTMALSARRASLIASTSNYTISSTTFLTPPTPIPLNPTELLAYRRVLTWLLNFTATDIPPPSSIAQNFWSSGPQLMDPNPLAKVALMQNWHSILAFPVWMFNGNNYGNPALQSNEIVEGLPAELYTRASIVVPYAKLKVDDKMLVCFLVLQGVVLAFVWAVIGWVWMRSAVLPASSSFVLVDSVFNVEFKFMRGVKWDWEDGVSDGRILELALDSRVYAKVMGRGDDMSRGEGLEGIEGFGGLVLKKRSTTM